MVKKFIDWEKWPFALIYAPLIFVWMYYAFKAKAFWFMSNVNPTLEFSGFEGETKQEMYVQLPTESYPQTLYVKAGESFDKLKARLLNSGLTYPFIVKPEIGMQGLLFRKIEKESDLLYYHTYLPFDYVMQALVDLPIELSVFHIRYPGQVKGKITGFILKEYMTVLGDGKNDLLTLMMNHPKAKRRMIEMKAKHEKHLHLILPAGKKFILSMAGNHNRGAKFVNLHKQIDDALCAVFDKISLYAGKFYYGRYDVKCASIEELKHGKNFSILEFNGTGAEPNHIYDCGMSYKQALDEIQKHWADMYRIGKINLQAGHPYWGFWKGYKYLANAKKFFKLMREYDINMDVEK